MHHWKQMSLTQWNINHMSLPPIHSFQKMVFSLKIKMKIKCKLYLNLIQVFIPKKQIEWMLIPNILQEFRTKSIYLKYQLPVRQSSHRNRINYSFNALFKTIRVWRVKFLLLYSWFEWVCKRGLFEKSYHKLDLWSHTDKNKHPHGSAEFLMIQEAMQGL